MPQMDPRPLKVTSVNAEDENANSSTENHRRQLEPEDVHAALAQALGHLA